MSTSPTMIIPARQHLASFDGADRKAGEVIIARLVHPRHLRRLPADQRASGLAAALRDAGDQPPWRFLTSSFPQAK